MNDEQNAPRRAARDELFATSLLHHINRIMRLENRVETLEAKLAEQTAALAAEIAILKSQVRPPDE